MDSMSRGGRERGMHHTLPSNKYITLFRNDQVLGEIRSRRLGMGRHNKKNTPMVPPIEPTRRLFIEEPWIACRGAAGSVGCITQCQQQVRQKKGIGRSIAAYIITGKECDVGCRYLATMLQKRGCYKRATKYCTLHARCTNI